MGKELELAIKIGGKIDKSLGSAINNAQGQLNSLSNNVNKVATAATVAVAAAGAKVVVDAIEQSTNFEKSMAGVAKVVDGCRTANGKLTDTYYELSDGILEMSTQIPMAANDIASIVESAGQAGIAKNELLGFAQSAAKMGIAFDTTAEQAGDWMAQWRTSMGLTQTEVETLADQINYLGNTSSEKAVKLSEVVSRVGSLGKIAGLSGGQVAALAASMPGVEAEISATGIKNMTKAMTMGSAATKKQQEVLKKLGFSATDLAKRMQTDAQGAILDFLAAMNKLPKAEQSAALTRYFGSESVGAIAPLLSNLDNLKAQFDKVGDASKYAGSMQSEYEAASATTANSIQLLKNAYAKEQIELGNELLPIVSQFVQGLTEKMPEIGDIISESLQEIIPIASEVLDYLVDNSDKVISGAIGMAKAFAMFKLGTGAINTVNSITTLSKNLSKITKTAGAAKTLQGLIGTFSGVSTAAGTLGGAITGAAGTLITIIGPASLAAAAVLGVAAAIKAVQEKKLNFAAGMNENAKGIGEATTALIKYNDIAAEIPTLRQIISDENSSMQEVETAKARLQEIADLVSKEYNLTINADTSSLETAVNMAQQLNREDLINESSQLIKKAKSGASAYQENVNKVPGLEAQQKALEDQKTLYKGLQTEADLYYSSFENGLISNEKYLSQMNELYERVKASGADIDTSLIGDSLTNYNISEFERQLGNGLLSASTELNQVNKDLTLANNNISEFDESVRTSSEYLTQALANDVKNNNAFGITSDVSMLQELGTAMIAAGKSTDEVATKFAAAKAGYTDFAAAIGDGKAQEMAQNFIGYKTSIGETTESAIAGAAVIASQFENVTKATEAGAEGINSVLSNMRSLGDAQGLFEGITTPDGVADKLTDMAHAIGLIPESKSVTIDTNGNLSVITDAENKIASLNSYGNVDVSVNSNGDLTVLNEATNNTQTLQALGAVALQVNAETGNIEALNNAQQVVAQINGKTGKVTVTAQDNATAPLTVIEQKLGVVNEFPVKPTVNITDNASTTIDSVSRKLTNLHGTTATTTVVTTYKTEGTPPGENARGTSNWRGGLTYVNDQNVRDPRELIEYNGMRYWYEGRNILANVPKGAVIHTASDSRAYINGSHRNGLTRVPFDGYIAELHKDERVLTADEAGDYGERGMFSQAVERVREWLSTKDKPQSGGGSAVGGEKIVFSPQIVVQGNADEGSIRQALRMSFSEFKELMEEYEQEKRRIEF